MIELTVKTLDSQNHQFSVEDAMTVGEFKVHIADKVNIPAATQRIIYCGRVLQDNDKLSDYDVQGKVVHLVQRAPPSANPRSDANQGSSSSSDNTNHNRGPGGGGGGGGGFMGFDRVGNAVYLGSMAFGNEPSHIPQRATHNLSASRLNVARRMLRGAEHAINHLENPNDSNEQSPPAEPNTEEEMTPVIEARVVVPNNPDQPMDESAMLSAVENSLFGGPANNMQVDSSPESSQNQTSQANENNTALPEETNESDPNSAEAPQSTPAGNSQPSNSSNGARPSRVRTARGPEMAELLTTLNQLQWRFAPFLARYQTFLQDDPQIPTDNVQSTQRMLRLVSQTMHYLSHAYHSLSDILIDVEQAPPRLLMCRPILIQQSAMVHAGIPFQLEAQINVSSDGPQAGNDSGGTTGGTGSPPSTTAASGTTGQGQTTRTIPTSIPNANINITQGPSTNMEFIGLPFMPAGGSMRVITTPIEIRAVRANGGNGRPRAPNNNNNSSQPAAQQATTESSTPPTNEDNADNQQQGQQHGQQPQGQQPQGPPTGPFAANSNMEFVVEVTPEVFRGAMNGPPPEFIQSLMQLVNSQLFNRPGQQPQQNQQQQQPEQRADGTAQSTQNQPVGTPSGQNSQARGNTQTHPTTSTHTRSTSRPHIQMTQQAVQGGFDPYLPCYSHHVVHHRHRIFNPVSTTSNAGVSSSGQQRANQSNARNNAPNATAGGQSTRETANLGNLFGPLINDTQNLEELMAVSRAAENLVAMLSSQAPSVRHPQQPQQSAAGEQQQNAQPAGRGGPPGRPNPFFPPASFLSRMFRGSGNDMHIGVTLDQLLTSLSQEDSYTPGESLLMDLLMLLLRNLRITDLFLLNSGNLTPLNQNRVLIQDFFRRDVCRNDVTPLGIQNASDRVIDDMYNVINSFELVPTRDNIDLQRSIQALLRHHIPRVINVALNLSSDEVRPLVDDCWTAGRQLLALVLHCAVNGQQDLENVMEDVMTRNMIGIPADVQSWTNANSRIALRSVIDSLNVPNADVSQFIVYKNVENTTNQSEDNRNRNEQSSASDTSNGVEMDIDIRRMVMEEPIPYEVLGSESWHRQTSEDWVPIITRDVYRQRRQNTQPAFSDAYLSGMPSKRRKLYNNSKPQTTLPQVIKESLRQAVTSTGLAAATPLDNVVAAASTSTEIVTAYRNMVHSTVQENLKENEDFNAEQFPNASNYFSKSFE